jgi:hypothetical protein
LPAADVHATGETAPAAHAKRVGHAVCVTLAVDGDGQKKPAVHWFAVDAVLVPAALRHLPAAHAVHTDAVPVLEYPTAHTCPTAAIVVDPTVCDVLTVPVHAPVVHGLGEMVATNVPAVTPRPAIIMPTPSEPVVIAETVSVVVAIEPVKTAATPLQKRPAGHGVAALAPAAPAGAQ